MTDYADDEPDFFLYDDDPALLSRCACGQYGYEACGCCGAPLCGECFETQAGFCLGLACATEKRLQAMDEALGRHKETDDAE